MSAPIGLPATAHSRVALNCLTSASSIFAVAVLVINDHILKVWSPSWITGKLSDFAGLYFIPFVLLAAIFAILWLIQRAPGVGRARVLSPWAERAVTVGGYAAVAALFTALKLGDGTAYPALGVVKTVTGKSFSVTVDPSDLVALVVLIPSALLWRDRLRLARQRPLRLFGPQRAIARWKVAQLSVLAIAAAGIVGTSPPPFQPAVISLAPDPHDRKSLYATVGRISYSKRETRFDPDEKAPRLFLSASSGARWTEIGEGGQTLVPDPRRRGTVYFARGDEIWVTSNGETPRLIWPSAGGSTPLPMVAPDWKEGRLFVGGRSPAMTEDSGQSWKSLVLAPSAAGPITALATAPSRQGLVFASNASLLKSDDAGSSWVPVAPLEEPLRALAVHPGNARLLIGATSNSIMRSIDGGVSWRQAWATDDDLYPLFAVMFDPEREGRVYAVRYRWELLVSEDAGESWATSLRADVHELAVTRWPDRETFVAGGSTGAFRLREPAVPDPLSRWQPVDHGLMPAGGLLFGPFSWFVAFVESLLVLSVFLAGSVAARFFGSASVRRSLSDNAAVCAFGIWAVIPAALVIGGLFGFRLSKPADLLLVGAWLPLLGLLILLRKRPRWWAIVLAALGVAAASLVLLSAAALLAMVLQDSPWFMISIWLPGALIFLAELRRLQWARDAALTVVVANAMAWVLVADGFPFNVA